MIMWVLLFLVCGVAVAQEAAPILVDDVVQPSLPMMKEILAFLQSIPKVGPYIKIVIEGAAAVTVFCTAMVAFLKTVLSISYIATAKFAPGLAKSIKDFETKILPWFKYLSMMNASKEELKKASVPKLLI